jgi:hypothetical protein
MVVQRETAILGDLVLTFLDLGIVELFNFATP